MALRYGIDTSVLVRLVTGEPEQMYVYCLDRLTSLIEDHDAEFVASNQVIGETYVTVQHHYGMTRMSAKAGLLAAFEIGLAAPLHGDEIISMLQESDSPGIFDKLIANDYEHNNLEVFTLDRRMSSLANAHRL